MKLDQWLDTPKTDGTKRVRGDFARAIGVTPQMISAYCSGTIPNKDRMEAIIRETSGDVTANDFYDVEPAQ
jgi:DNA-binding transcriptional regulator YdaS (Cro superfamily)